MTFTTLYVTLLVLAFGGYFAIKYTIKGLTKIGAFDDDGESRYSPPTKSTYVGFWVTSTVLVILFLLTAL